mmetsp:Transcript_18676/g.22952  ORF Transcript_18676/g.22952 Transcript_18676/m.22952 type:complete len:97 (-) Transcript_18676:41-331(-)
MGSAASATSATATKASSSERHFEKCGYPLMGREPTDCPADDGLETSRERAPPREKPVRVFAYNADEWEAHCGEVCRRLIAQESSLADSDEELEGFQ